ncbi:MAG TPA: class I SAM-dependent methyltransferase [Solirubrobacteraceae bacterium]|nr:class I SAM-dependent methyltransferase [Solirubrobacteraceae bacterium]
MTRRRQAATAACPFCGGPGPRMFDAWDRNRETTRERFAYARCRTCGTVFLIDPPADLGRYYAEDYYHFGPDGTPAWRSDEPRMRSAAYRVDLLRAHTARGRLIEIGAGTGAFASAAKSAGYEVSAIEMSERCCRYLSEHEGIDAICSDRPLDAIASLPPARVVALWHVLEHLPSPAEVLARVADKVLPGGLLAIGVPNPRSLQFRVLRSRWAHLDAPRHLCLIPPAALIARGRELGMASVALSTNDPDGLECNFFGWVSALRRRPAVGATPDLVSHAARAIERGLAPLERTGNRGSAVTILMRKEP